MATPGIPATHSQTAVNVVPHPTFPATGGRGCRLTSHLRADRNDQRIKKCVMERSLVLPYFFPFAAIRTESEK